MLDQNGVLNAAFEAQGLFDFRRFVLRLAPELHRRLEKFSPGIVAEQLNREDLLANSVYLHETWHWWQHAGSTFGFLSGLVNPAQTHANTKYLKDVLASLGAQKSMYQMLVHSKNAGGPASQFGVAHVIVNNFADLRTYQAMCSHPEKAKVIASYPLFEAKGHGFGITYMNIISMLARSVDRKFETLPDPRPWEHRFDTLRASRAKHFFRGSPLYIPPVGAFQLFEGQCRYNQLLFLWQGSGRAFDWNEAEARGMLRSPYDDAFRIFLELLGEIRPKEIDNPIVGLFLLVCDLALNPTSGFPCAIDFESDFVAAVDPGTRFFRLTRAAANQKSAILDMIRDYSREEYCEAGKLLTTSCGYATPLTATGKVCEWIQSSEEIRRLTDLHTTYGFPAENYPVAFLLSHFLAFSKDKHDAPEIFCWPGKYTAGTRVNEKVAELLERHGAPFIDGAEDTTIHPRLRSGLSETAVHAAFLSFYQFILMYDLTEQWVLRPGAFAFDLAWLRSTSSQEQLREFSESAFKSVYGRRTEDFDIL